MGSSENTYHATNANQGTQAMDDNSMDPSVEAAPPSSGTVDPKSSGKKRFSRESRSAGVKRDFQDFGERVIDTMEKS